LWDIEFEVSVFPPVNDYLLDCRFGVGTGYILTSSTTFIVSSGVVTNEGLKYKVTDITLDFTKLYILSRFNEVDKLLANLVSLKMTNKSTGKTYQSNFSSRDDGILSLYNLDDESDVVLMQQYLSPAVPLVENYSVVSLEDSKGMSVSKALGKNLFDKDNLTLNYRLDHTNGHIVANTNGYVSDYMFLEEITIDVFTLMTNYSFFRLCYFDVDKKYISGTQTTNPTTKPSNACYARISNNEASQPKDDVMVNVGTSALPYEPYLGYTHDQEGLIPVSQGISMPAMSNGRLATYVNGVNPIADSVGRLKLNKAFCDSDGTLNPDGLYFKADPPSNLDRIHDITGILYDLTTHQPIVKPVESQVANENNQFFVKKEWKATNQEVFPIRMKAGLMDFSITNTPNLKWYFPDGSTSTLERPGVTLAEDGIVYAVGDWNSSSEIRNNDTDANYVGELIDIPWNLTFLANFYNCTLLTGDISALSNLTNYAKFYNCILLTGNISALSNLTNYAKFYNCTLLTGDISALSNLAYLASFGNCTLLTGDISALSNLTNYASFYNCTLLTGDISALSNLTSLASFYNCTLLTGNISALSNLTSYANFNNCILLTGNISALSNLTSLASFQNCTLLTGILNPHSTLKYLILSNTGLSTNDCDQTIINLNNNTIITDGTLNISGLTRSSLSDSAIANLIAIGWNVTDATVE